MKFLLLVVFCCVVAVCVEASSRLEVKGHAGGEVSIHCSGNWTASGGSERSSVYFCRGVCSGENVLIRSEGRPSGVTQRGRYSADIDRRAGVFTVTIKNLRSADAGLYHCGAGTAFNVTHQFEISLTVLDAPTVPHGPPPVSNNTPQSGADAGPRGNFLFSSEPSEATLTLPPSEEKTNQRGVTKLTGTTVVIIVSGSLAFLVCAIIPFIFYGHWRSSPDDQNRLDGDKDEGEYSERNAEVASAQAAVQLQAFEPKVEPESSVQDSSQYAAIYQALDPKTLD